MMGNVLDLMDFKFKKKGLDGGVRRIAFLPKWAVLYCGRWHSMLGFRRISNENRSI
jgi:hypothetical protein